MKKSIQKSLQIALLCSIFFSLFSAQAQAPQKMGYQAVVRNTANALVANTLVGVKISVLQTTATGTVVYSERHTPTTNANGLATFEIGNGVILTGTMAGINWAAGPYFIKTETDPAGGTNYTIAGTSQLASVPYALFAANAVPSALSWNITGTNISNNNAGNVGIGQAAPTEKLQVNGNTKIGEAVWGVAADDKVLKFGDASYVTIGEVGADDRMEIKANEIILNAVNGDVLIPTGDVGIGIGNPDAILGSRLEVLKGAGTTKGALTLYGTEHTSEFYNFAQENVYLRGGKTGSNVIINDTPGLGNVGIGTPTPDTKLDVEGGMRISENASALGTVFKQMQGGNFYIGPSASCTPVVPGGIIVVYKKTFTFPNAFVTAPKILLTVKQEPGNFFDQFEVSTRNVTTTTFEIIISRRDYAGDNEGWGQQLTLDWIAFSN